LPSAMLHLRVKIATNRPCSLAKQTTLREPVNIAR
jgi:hypothetical protein